MAEQDYNFSTSNKIEELVAMGLSPEEVLMEKNTAIEKERSKWNL